MYAKDPFDTESEWTKSIFPGIQLQGDTLMRDVFLSTNIYMALKKGHGGDGTDR